MNTSQFEYFERDTFRSSEIKCPGRREWEGDTYIGEGNWHLGTDTNYFYHIPFICLSLAVMDPRNASKTANVPIPLIIGWLSYLCWSGKPEQQCSKHVFSDITAVNTAITGSDLTVFKLKHLGLLEGYFFHGLVKFRIQFKFSVKILLHGIYI